MHEAPTIGFIGLGVMGGPMCRNVVGKHAAAVHAYDRDPAALGEAAGAGAHPERSPAEIGAASDIGIDWVGSLGAQLAHHRHPVPRLLAIGAGMTERGYVADRGNHIPCISTGTVATPRGRSTGCA